MPQIAIQARGLGKQYRIGGAVNSFPTLRDALARRFSAAGRRASASAAPREMFWALRDVSFDVQPGEIVGIVGSNGAGKSTLLKILSRVSLPTAGEALIHGRLGSLLEIGTGFHPELTGRENIYLNGAVLGMRRAEIARKFDEILAFAEVQRFVDTPVKHYSSGMYMRLAFAVAAHLETEILVVDEVLAVGDAAFQRKCLGKMRDVAGGGRTVLFVSHNLDAVRRLCTRALLVENGMLALDDTVSGVVSRYLSQLRAHAGSGDEIDLRGRAREGSGTVRFVSAVYGTGGDAHGTQPWSWGPLVFDLELSSDQARVVPRLAISLHDRFGVKLLSADTIATGTAIELRAGITYVRVTIEALALNPGEYIVGLWAADKDARSYDNLESAFVMDVVPDDLGGSGTATATGAVACRFVTEVRG
jgi:lipopolysaccharide transport system ATP-binding protein